MQKTPPALNCLRMMQCTNTTLPRPFLLARVYIIIATLSWLPSQRQSFGRCTAGQKMVKPSVLDSIYDNDFITRSLYDCANGKRRGYTGQGLTPPDPSFFTPAFPFHAIATLSRLTSQRRSTVRCTVHDDASAICRRRPSSDVLGAGSPDPVVLYLEPLSNTGRIVTGTAGREERFC
ncbi:hypothetical protein EVAR_100193_1 [Eumeta japonica]|uniref:Uncharacterized protein n=1 Tax=Eumeta variegata TaxID=151549 RepID=A0A4C2A9P9_EUMVA|nr:hypothetical protein EVAR_100193_1 [Eumeta japonica]